MYVCTYLCGWSVEKTSLACKDNLIRGVTWAIFKLHDGNVWLPDMKNRRLSGCGESIPDQEMVKITLNAKYLSDVMFESYHFSNSDSYVNLV